MGSGSSPDDFLTPPFVPDRQPSIPLASQSDTESPVGPGPAEDEPSPPRWTFGNLPDRGSAASSGRSRHLSGWPTSILAHNGAGAPRADDALRAPDLAGLAPGCPVDRLFSAVIAADLATIRLA
jgi:hypothetical protein